MNKEVKDYLTPKYLKETKKTKVVTMEIRKQSCADHSKKPRGIYKVIEIEESGDVLISTVACMYVYAQDGWVPMNWMQDISRPFDIVFMRGQYPNIEYLHVQIKATTINPDGWSAKNKKNNINVIPLTTSGQRLKEAHQRRGQSAHGAAVIEGGDGKEAWSRYNTPVEFKWDELFAFNEEGEFCIWTKDDVAGYRCSISWGKNCSRRGKIDLKFNGNLKNFIEE